MQVILEEKEYLELKKKADSFDEFEVRMNRKLEMADFGNDVLFKTIDELTRQIKGKDKEIVTLTKKIIGK